MSKILTVYYSRKGQNYWNGSIIDLKKGNTEIVAEIMLPFPISIFTIPLTAPSSIATIFPFNWFLALNFILTPPFPQGIKYYLFNFTHFKPDKTVLNSEVHLTEMIS